MDSVIPNGQKNILAEYMILSGGDNRPPMLDKDLKHGRMILESFEHDPLIWPTIKENGVTRTKKYTELSATGKIQADCDLKATNIILQGLPSDIYSVVNHHRVAKDLWERIQLLMQVNTKFLNSLPPEWSKFVTDVKLVKDLHTTNFDQLHAYLQQHKLHANEVRIMRECNQDPLALVANHQQTPSHFNTYQSSYNNPQFQQQFSPSPSPQYGSIHPTQHYSTTYPSPPLQFLIHQHLNQQTHLAKFPQIDSGLAVPVFKQGDDLINAINKIMSFLSTVGRQNSFAAGISGTRANISGTGGNNSGQQRVVKCFNYQGEGHMARQCPKPKRKRDATCFRNKVLLVKAQGNGIVLNEEELEFLAVTDQMFTTSVIAKETNVISIAGFEETLLLEEESRSKMLLKESDPMVSENKVNIKPINYAELNRLSEDFGKSFVPQQELSDEQAFRLQTSHPNTNQSASSPVKIEAPRELPKVILVNTSLKKLKYHLGQFENVVKKQITPDALTDGKWGFEHTKGVFLKEIIPFVKTLKDIFNIFDKDLLNEKLILIENDRLLDQIISQDIVNIVVNYSLDINTFVNVNSSAAMNDSVNYVEMCNKCLEFEAELIKQHNMVEKDEYNRL
ncbi:integrase, catalytic region, zinc finger, CCHC-type containing protein [Tanacetum coccineum]